MPRPPYPRWPLLTASTALFGIGLALDLTDASQYGLTVGISGLAAACLGAFLYAEGARHREWTTRERRSRHARHARDTPKPGPDPDP